MIENFRNPFFCVLWLILSLEKWLLGFWEQNLIFGVRFYILRGPTVWFWMVFATLSSKWAFKALPSIHVYNVSDPNFD